MKITRWLRADHELIEALIEDLERACIRPALERQHDLERYLALVLWTLETHEYVEERLVFPQFERSGIELPPGVLETLRQGHTHVGQDLRGLWLAIESGRAEQERQTAADFLRRLRRHIRQEESILLPLIEKHIPDEVQTELGEAARRSVVRRPAGVSP